MTDFNAAGARQLFNRTKPKTEQVAAVAQLAAVRQRMLAAAQPLDEVAAQIAAIMQAPLAALQRADADLAEALAANQAALDEAIVLKPGEKNDSRAAWWDRTKRGLLEAAYPARQLPISPQTIRRLQHHADSAHGAVLEAEAKAAPLFEAGKASQGVYEAVAAEYAEARRQALVSLGLNLVRQAADRRRDARKRDRMVRLIIEALGPAHAAPITTFLYSENQHALVEDERQGAIVAERFAGFLSGDSLSIEDVPPELYEVESRPAGGQPRDVHQEVSQSFNLLTGRLIPSGEPPTPDQRRQFETVKVGALGQDREGSRQ